jgi:hypothetical protein
LVLQQRNPLKPDATLQAKERPGLLSAKNLAERLTASDYLRKSFGLYVFCGPSRGVFWIVRVTKNVARIGEMGNVELWIARLANASEKRYGF